MQKSILNLKSPVIGLSPMDGVTDAPFRKITKKYGNPDLIYTEFVNVMGLCIAGYNTLKELIFEEIERPIIGQIYGKDPEYFYHSAKILCALGFDGVDINMGCPAKNVAQSGSGAALIRTPELAKEIISATKQGVKDWVINGELTGLNEKTHRAVIDQITSHQISDLEVVIAGEVSKGYLNLRSQIKGTGERHLIPTSVKTRIGYDKPVTEEWIKNIESADPAWIAVHGRTLKQMYTGFADRTELKKAVDSTDKAVLINGDIDCIDEAHKAIDETGAFGALIGRGSFGNPWVFNKNLPLAVSHKPDTLDPKDRLKLKVDVMLEHTKEFIELYPDPRAFFQMRKHFGWYMKGYDGAKEMRMKLMTASSLSEIEEIIKSAN